MLRHVRDVTEADVVTTGFHCTALCTKNVISEQPSFRDLCVSGLLCSI